MFEKLKVTVEAFKQTKSIEGHGEGIEYKGITFYYRASLKVPKDKVVHLAWEGNFCGRSVGEKEYIIVVWDGNDFIFLDHVYDGIKNASKKYKGKTCEEAIFIRKKEQEEIRLLWEKGIKCKCGKVVLVLGDGQPKDVCFECFTANKEVAKK